MRLYLLTVVCPFLFACLLGCSGTHSRPESVPSSAIWVDNTFVDCSVETQSRANRCTVYKGDRGDVLADGLFVLNTSHMAAEKSELHYAAFGERGIYLDDLRILVQRTASQRDPSHRIIDERLKTLAASGAAPAVDCTNVRVPGRTDAGAECALSAFANKKPFWIRYYEPGTAWYVYSGYASTADGTVYYVFYHHGDWIGFGDSDGKMMDDNQTFVVKCPKPTILTKTKNGALTCAQPVA